MVRQNGNNEWEQVVTLFRDELPQCSETGVNLVEEYALDVRAWFSVLKALPSGRVLS